MMNENEGAIKLKSPTSRQKFVWLECRDCRCGQAGSDSKWFWKMELSGLIPDCGDRGMEQSITY